MCWGSSNMTWWRWVLIPFWLPALVMIFFLGCVVLGCGCPEKWYRKLVLDILEN